MLLLETKLKRLKTLRKRRPQDAEIYDFHTALSQFLHRQPNQWLSFSTDLKSWDSRRQAGFPLLTGAELQIDPEPAGKFFAALVENLIELGQEGKSELNQIADAQKAGSIPIKALLVACLEKDRAPLEAFASELQIPSALLEYICSTTLAFGLQEWLKEIPRPDYSDWKKGYCPICGGAPSMGELAGKEGEKRLHCSICTSDWSVTRLKCSYCGNEESDSLEYFTAEGEAGYRVDICRKCSGYLKVVDSRELGEGLPMDVEDLNTLYLDLIAQKEGFVKGKRTLKN
ncbi:MAG: formate dehydrogenase accessory protein FdhE [Desulfuromonadales bacterium]|nr:formate dehydrogenase accessory protein FdhE [Desulfuromonadales bacterium]